MIFADSDNTRKPVRFPLRRNVEESSYYQRPNNQEFAYRTAVILIITCFWFLSVAAASAANFTASLDRDTISLGENVTLTLFFDGSEPKTAPVLPSIPGLTFGNGGRSAQQGVSFDNGVVQRTYQFTYTFSVTASRIGIYTIPPITAVLEGQTFLSQPLKLSVGKAPTVNPNTAFLKLILPKTQVYLGEILPLDIQLYFQAIRGPEAPHLKEEGFTLGHMKQVGQSATMLNNQRYEILQLKTFVVPVKAGQVELGPATMGMQVPKPGSRVDFFNRPVDWQPFTAESEPLTLQVLPLPKENVPADFNGAVGSYTVTLTASPTNIAVGDPITIKVQISGRGAVENITLPTQESWQQFKLYPPTSEFQPGDDMGMSGAKTFSLTAVPQNLDVKELPPFTFSFFDPELKSYRTVTQPAVPLVVRPSAASLPPPIAATPTTSEIAPTNSDIIPLKVRLGEIQSPRSPLAVRPWFVILQAIPVIAWLALLINRRRAERLANNPRLRRQIQVAQTVRDGLAQLQQFADANQAADFFATLFRLLQEQIGERLNLPASSITESVLDEHLRPLNLPPETLDLLQELFLACNQARYALESTHEELVSLIPKVEIAINELKQINA